MPSTISPAASLAELVVERPSRSRVFEQLGLDYCCGGNRTLEEVCRERGLEVPAVLEALATSTQTEPVVDWTAAPIADLVDHIVGVYHAGLRHELPRLTRLLDAVVGAHGDDRPELYEVRRVFEVLRCELEGHLAEEERDVFPDCRATGGRQIAPETLSGLVGEHAETGRLLARLAELTGGFSQDGALCGTHRAAIDGLHELAHQTFEHVHFENNLLFPRVLASN